MTTFNQPHSEFVDADEFCQMLVSRRLLIRQDDGEQGLRGLWDPQSETVYLIEEQKLARFRNDAAARVLAV